MWGPPRGLPEICMYCALELGALKMGKFASPVTADFIAFFPYKMSADLGGETPARQRVKWQVDKMVVILEAAVPIPSLRAEVGTEPRSGAAPCSAKKILLLLMRLTRILCLFMPSFGINTGNAPTFTLLSSNSDVPTRQPSHVMYCAPVASRTSSDVIERSRSDTAAILTCYSEMWWPDITWDSRIWCPRWALPFDSDLCRFGHGVFMRSSIHLLSKWYLSTCYCPFVHSVLGTWPWYMVLPSSSS